ncbi:MAG: hypothetical protein UV56_C0026G0002 [Candidatus Woesebacteria bacterium GW2011_GWC1_43_10b]|uniref:DUF5660 domain-containing protein n=1 Tax=Candidatus Woesebacteria bacterium GW2011_GWC1_43_10b TaxID=1618585 RepID=A0A0G1C3B9_9BACT|nr:MAG: hypothetical protein UV56_C0026G0002 [Candidatus Woesebacteria bacterium GW2011_GWC1_43_10b]
MNDKNPKTKAQKISRQANVLESFKDIGGNTLKTMRQDLLKGSSEELARQLFGLSPAPRKFEGEINPGEDLVIDEVFSGKREGTEKAQKQVAFERRLHQEEKELLDQKSGEIKLQLGAIMQEMQALAQATPELAKEIEIAAVQAPVNPGLYHVIFFQKILEFIKSFRKKINNASDWLYSVNKRAAKKNAWGARYQQHGAKYLLSGEHYLTRSAG